MRTKCPECDSGPESWTWFASAEGTSPVGPIAQHPKINMVLGCDDCSATLKIIDIDKWLEDYCLTKIHLSTIAIDGKLDWIEDALGKLHDPTVGEENAALRAVWQKLQPIGEGPLTQPQKVRITELAGRIADMVGLK